MIRDKTTYVGSLYIFIEIHIDSAHEQNIEDVKTWWNPGS